MICNNGICEQKSRGDAGVCGVIGVEKLNGDARTWEDIPAQERRANDISNSINKWGMDCYHDEQCGSSTHGSQNGIEFGNPDSMVPTKPRFKLRCYKKKCLFVHQAKTPVKKDWGMLANGSKCKEKWECRARSKQAGKGAYGKKAYMYNFFERPWGNDCMGCNSGICTQTGGLCGFSEFNVRKRSESDYVSKYD